MINMHPVSDLLLEYTSGSLATAPTIAITTHLQFCDHCRTTVDSLKDVGGNLLDQSEGVDVSEDLFSRVLSCISESKYEADVSGGETAKTIDEVGNALPAYVQRFMPEGDLSWKFLSPSLRVAPISVGEDEFEVALHRIKPGGRAPAHDHHNSEITVVLTGSFSDEDGVYHPGDFIVREPGDVHRPSAAQHEECICLSVLAGPIKLTGIKGLLNPFLSFSPS